MRETADPLLAPDRYKLRPSCDRTLVFRDITTITSGFGAVTISPEHHSLIADKPIMTTVAFPTLRHNYRYKKASKEGHPQAFPAPEDRRSPVVAVAPARPLATPSRTASSVPSMAASAPGLPSDFSAVSRDIASWALWLFLATLIRTLLSTHRILYPRLLLIGVAAAALIQMTAWCVTWRYWPWASTRVMPFVIVAGAGFALGSCFLDLATKVHLLPWTASLAGSAVAVTDQWRLRLRWRAHARRPLEAAS